MSTRQSHLSWLMRYAGSCRAKLTGYAFLKGHNFGKGQGTGEEGGRGGCTPCRVTLTVMSRRVASVLLLGQGLASRSASSGVCLTESERAKEGKTDRRVDTGQTEDTEKVVGQEALMLETGQRLFSGLFQDSLSLTSSPHHLSSLLLMSSLSLSFSHQVFLLPP